MRGFQIPTGSEWLRLPFIKAAFVVFALTLGVVVAKGGVVTGMMVLGLPLGIFGFAGLMKYPRWNLWGSLGVGFFSAGIARYVDAPWGLLVDVFLVVGWLSLILKLRKKEDWQPLRNDVMLVTLVWYGMVLLELANPEMRSVEAWIYAMRGAGLYQLLAFGLTFLLFRHPKYLDQFLYVCIFFSLLGVLWGFRQMIFGTDKAEDYWLYVEGYAMTHILHGVLRVFSFYSDAGQFGAQQALMALV
ncbi:MAG: O-antigen ligase domain-containing protein, partial [Bacteroidota bacterium]